MESDGPKYDLAYVTAHSAPKLRTFEIGDGQFGCVIRRPTFIRIERDASGKVIDLKGYSPSAGSRGLQRRTSEQ